MSPKTFTRPATNSAFSSRLPCLQQSEVPLFSHFDTLFSRQTTDPNAPYYSYLERRIRIMQVAITSRILIPRHNLATWSVALLGDAARSC